MLPAKVNLTLITAPAVETGEAEFYLSTVEPMEGDGAWGFNLYGNDQIFIAQFIYRDEGHARRGAVGITASIVGAIYVGPDEGDDAGVPILATQPPTKRP